MKQVFLFGIIIILYGMYSWQLAKSCTDNDKTEGGCIEYYFGTG